MEGAPSGRASARGKKTHFWLSLEVCVKRALAVLVLSLAVVMSGCGGGSGGHVGPPPPPTLSSIAVTTTTAKIAPTTTAQFVATGTFSDGSTQNLTNSVNWSSSATAVATISNTAGTKG